MQNKKIIFIIAISAVIGLIVLSYFLSNYFNQRNNNAGSGQQDLSQAELVKAIGEKIYFPQFVKSQNAIYFFGDQGSKLKKYSLATNNIEELYPQELLYVKNLKMSPDGQKALLLIQEGDYFVYKILDINSKTLKDYQKDIFDADWLGNQVVYSKDQKIFAETPLASESDLREITQLPFGSAVITPSPDNKFAIIYQEPEGYGQNYLYLLSLETKKLEKLPDQYNLVGALWSPDSKKIVSSQYNSDGVLQNLVFTDIETKKQNTGLLSTILEKIAWIDSDNLFVTVSKDNENDLFNIVTADTQSTMPLQFSFQDPYQNLPLNLQNPMINEKKLYFTSNDYLYKYVLP